MALLIALVSVFEVTVPVDSSALEKAFQEDGATGFSSAVDDYVKQCGAQAAAKILVKLVVGHDREMGAAAVNAIGGMGKAGREVLPELIQVLNCENFPCEYLDEYDPGDIPLWLAEYLVRPGNDSPADTGTALAWKFDLTREKRLVPILIQGITHANLDVRFWAVYSLGEMGETARDASPLLRDLLRKEAPHDLSLGEIKRWNRVRGASAFAIARIGVEPERCVPLLTQMLEHPDSEIWTRASLGLGLFGEHATGAIPALVKALVKHDGRLPPAPLRHAAATALRNIGEPAVPALIDALHSDNVAVRRHVAEAFFWKPSEKLALDALLEAASRDPDAQVRVWATRALRFPAASCANARTLLSTLNDIVEDDNSEVRESIAYVLGALNSHDEAWERLVLRLLGDQDPGVRRAALAALPRRSSTEAISTALERLLDDSDEEVRRAARETIRRLQDESKTSQRVTRE